MISQEFQPKKFSEILGQSETVQVLKSIVKNPDNSPKSIIIQGESGSGKCVLPSTRVFTSKGYIPISSLLEDIPAGFHNYITDVYTREGIKQSSHVYKELDCKVNLLHLKNGECINGTDKHRVLAVKDGIVKLHYLEDLQLGDSILFPKVILGKDWESDEEWAYLVGAWVANGFSTQYDCRFTGTYEQCKVFAEKAGWSASPQTHINNTYFVHKGKDTEGFDLRGTVTNKTLPERLFLLNSDSRTVFLKTLLELKGELIKDDVILKFKSEFLVKDLLTLLHTLGVTSFIGDKSTILRIPLKNLSHLNLTINGVLLTSKSEVIQFVDGLKVSKLFREHRRDYLNQKHVNDFSMTLANKIKSSNELYFNDLTHYKSLYNSLPSNLELYFYDDVEIVSKDSTNSDVYDLSIPDIHEFYCQGTINHNTAISKVFTKALLCSNSTSLEPCGKCATCSTDLNNSDCDFFKEVTPNLLIEPSYISSQLSCFINTNKASKQVLVLDEINLVSEEVQAGILGLLDKNLSNTFYILCTTEPNKIFPSISYRSLELRLNKISDEELATKITNVCNSKSLDIDYTLVQKIVNFSKGNIQKAYKLIDSYIIMGKESFEVSLRDPLTYLEQYGRAVIKKDKFLLQTVLKDLSTFPLPVLVEALSDFIYEFMRALTGLPSKIDSSLPKAFGSKAILFTKHLISDWVANSLRSDIEFQAALMAVYQLML